MSRQVALVALLCAAAVLAVNGELCAWCPPAAPVRPHREAATSSFLPFPASDAPGLLLFLTPVSLPWPALCLSILQLTGAALTTLCSPGLGLQP